MVDADEHQQQLAQLGGKDFSVMDTNQDGSVDRYEFKAAGGGVRVTVRICDQCNHHAALANTNKIKWEKVLDDFLTMVGYHPKIS